jgi:predicted nucleic acid-binding protein
MLSVYPDTSLLFSLYTPRPSSRAAAAAFAALDGPLPVTTLLLYEFENGARFAAWMNGRDKRKGFPLHVAQTALARIEVDLEAGVLEMVPCDLHAVVGIARRLSNARTWRGGYRSFDILHVATACHLKAKRFLTFDADQRKLAKAEGLQVGP